MNQSIQSSKMAELLAKLKASRVPPEEPKIEEPTTHQTIDKYGNAISLNEKQDRFVKLASSGESCILIGAAGTGKTTTQRVVVEELIQTGRAGVLDAEDHKHLVSGSAGIVVCAYTRRAVANIRRNMPDDMKANCITIHKLLEYQPVYDEVMDPITGDSKTKMSFEATRNTLRPLPESIHTIVFEESSMLGVDLYKEVINACPHKPQVIFLGDIQQLPPVFGPAILGFKLLELQVVELTEVYRQALESPIISLAHRILSANPLESSEFKAWKKPNQLTIHPWAKKISAETALQTAALFFSKAIETKIYDVEEDIILLPFNKAFGTEELNKHIANYISKQESKEVFEIVAGFNRIYLSVGDRVLYDKEDALVTKIEKNVTYSGAAPLPSSTTMDYWGYDPVSHSTKEEMSDESIDFMLNQVAAADSEDRVRQCSHIITLQMRDSDQVLRVSKASEVNSMLLGYALTVHKSQGSEWRKVFFVCHQSHATMLQRELLYTAVTRAREELYIICEPETFVKGILSQRVKGNTLEEKAEFFKGKIDEGYVL
jgi:exodeoxyribonuclease V alpha subunit